MAPKAGAASVQVGVSHWSAGDRRPIAKRMTQRSGARGRRAGSPAGGAVATATPPGAGVRRRLPPAAEGKAPPVAARPCRRGAGSLLSGRPASEPCRQQRGSLLTWGWVLRRAGCRQSPGLRSVGGPWEAWGERRGLAWPGGPDGRPGRGWPGARAGRAAGGELGCFCR